MIEQPPSPRFDRRLALAGAGLGGVLLGLLLLMTVCGGNGDQDEVGPVGPRPTTSTTPEASVRQARALADVTSAVNGGRDPFLPVVTAAKDPLSGEGPRAAPSVSAQPTTPPGSTASTPGQPVGAGYASLELKSTSQDGAGVTRAEITVDGQSYRPAKGETFAYGYRLERVDGNCVEVSAQAAHAQMCLPATPP